MMLNRDLFSDLLLLSRALFIAEDIRYSLTVAIMQKKRGAQGTPFITSLLAIKR
jgi:hypothetical protein